MNARLQSNGLPIGPALSRSTANVPAAAWAVLALPVIYLAHMIVTSVVPVVIRAVVPEVVQTVIRLI